MSNTQRFREGALAKLESLKVSEVQLMLFQMKTVVWNFFKLEGPFVKRLS